jgi:hypothetical protein
MGLTSSQQYLPYTVQHPQSPPASTISEQDIDLPQSSRELLAQLAKSTAKTRKSARIAKPIRVRRTPKPLKGKAKAKPNKQELRKLTVPLSELGEGYDHIPVRDMSVWVNRSIHERRQEVERRNGYITRPMNSFMLYRAAYAERTKIWCLQNNHQVVSKTTGSSWPMESAQVREQYEGFAKLERDNHAIAHPGYKFSPSKANSAAKKKKKKMAEASDTDSDPSDLDDFDYKWEPSANRKNKSIARKRSEREASLPATTAALALSSNHSAYQVTNPGKPLPAGIDGSSDDFFGQYYQTTIHPNPTMANVEDVTVRMTDAPGGGGLQMENNALTGIPGGWHEELFQSSHACTPMPMDENVDPFLRAQSGPSGEVYPQDNLYDAGGLFQGMPSTRHPQFTYPSMAPGIYGEATSCYFAAGQNGHNQVMPAWPEDFEHDLFPDTSVDWQQLPGDRI